MEDIIYGISSVLLSLLGLEYILKKVPARLIYDDTFGSLAFVHVLALNIYF